MQIWQARMHGPNLRHLYARIHRILRLGRAAPSHSTVCATNHVLTAATFAIATAIASTAFSTSATPSSALASTS